MKDPLPIKLKKKKIKGVVVWVIIVGAFALVLRVTFFSQAARASRINCSSFKTQKEAQTAFDLNKIRYKALDKNHDGRACENLLE